MANPPRPLSSLVWTPDLAGTLADTSAAIARLDSRISVASLASAWGLRARWAGYATALRLQQFGIEEIDLIAHHCAIHLPGRLALETIGSPFAGYETWSADLVQSAERHWRENLPFTFDLPDGWHEAPALVRALTLLDAWTRVDRSPAPWLSFPLLLQRMGITASALPCLVAGDPGQRFALDPRPALLKRLLKQVRRSAEDGLARLDRLEDTVRRSAAAIASEHRPGKLADLGRIALSRPCLAARSLAPQLDLTISGAGKLLERATRLGLMVEASGRGTWRTYVTPDVAQSLGLITPSRGRPRALPAPTRALESVLKGFDAEMAAIDARLEQLGVPCTPALDGSDDINME